MFGFGPYGSAPYGARPKLPALPTSDEEQAKRKSDEAQNVTDERKLKDGVQTR